MGLLTSLMILAMCFVVVYVQPVTTSEAWEPWFLEPRDMGNHTFPKYSSSMVCTKNLIYNSECSSHAWCPRKGVSITECKAACDTHTTTCAALLHNRNQECWLKRGRWPLRAAVPAEAQLQTVGCAPERQRRCGDKCAVTVHKYFVPYGSSGEIPTEAQKYVAAIQEAYVKVVPPSVCRIDFQLHSFSDGARVVGQIDPTLAYLYGRISPHFPAMRADLARLRFLHAYGGIYHDASVLFRSLTSFCEVIDELADHDGVFQRHDQYGRVGNTNLAISRRGGTLTHDLLMLTKCRMLQQLQLFEAGAINVSESGKIMFNCGVEAVVDVVKTGADAPLQPPDNNKRVVYGRWRSGESFAALYWDAHRHPEFYGFYNHRGKNYSAGQSTHWSKTREPLFSACGDAAPPADLQWPKSCNVPDPNTTLGLVS